MSDLLKKVEAKAKRRARRYGRRSFVYAYCRKQRREAKSLDSNFKVIY